VSVAYSEFRSCFRKLLVSVAIAAVSFGLAAFETVPKDQGIGGTGKLFRGDDNGISGTGYVGTITDFGSIIVNGREIEIDDNTSVLIDGVPSSVSDLKKGHVIAARSATINSVETAVTVQVFNTVVGQLSAFNQSTGLGVVLGQIVDFNSRFDREALHVGNWYAVSGLRAENSVVIASYVTPSSPGQFLVRGSTQEIKQALKSLGQSQQGSKKGNSLLLSGEILAGKVHIRKLQPFSVYASLKSPKTVLVESYLPRSGVQSGALNSELFDQKLVLPKSFEAATLGGRDRVILEAHRTSGHFVVKEAIPAAFVDRASENAKSLSQATIENSITSSLSGSVDDDQSKEIESDSLNSDDSVEQNSNETDDPGSDESNGSDTDQGETEGSDGSNSNNHDSGSENEGGSGGSGSGNQTDD